MAVPNTSHLTRNSVTDKAHVVIARNRSKNGIDLEEILGRVKDMVITACTSITTYVTITLQRLDFGWSPYRLTVFLGNPGEMSNV